MEKQGANVGLRAHLGTFQLFTIALGGMIGVGWIPLLGVWIGQAGFIGAALGFVFGGIVVSLVAIAYIHVGTRYPVTGGEAAYTLELFGRPWGFAVGWVLCLCYIAVCSFSAISGGWVLGALIPGIEGSRLYGFLGEDVRRGSLAIALGCSALLAILHIRNTDWVARVQDVLTGAFVVAAVTFILIGLLLGDVDNLNPMFETRLEGWRWSGVVTVFAVTPLFFGGFNLAVQMLGERAEGTRVKAIGAALLLSIIVATAFYVGVIVAGAMSMPRADLLGSSLPAAAAFRSIFASRWLGDLVLLAGLLGVLTSWNALLLAAARILYLLAGSGLTPEVFARIHPVHRTPRNAILFVSIVSALGIFGGIGVLGRIVGMASIAIAFAYVMVCFCALKIREERFRRSVLWLASAAALFVLVAALGEPFLLNPRLHIPFAWFVLGFWALLGGGFWWAVGRKKGESP